MMTRRHLFRLLVAGVIGKQVAPTAALSIATPTTIDYTVWLGGHQWGLLALENDYTYRAPYLGISRG